MADPVDRSRRSRRIRIAVQAAILIVILLALGTVGFVEYSAQPAFCTNCHNMRPYYESWATSTHNQVPCIKCHYAPGIKAEAMGKLQAANQVVKYVTGAYGTKPWAEIEDAACLRSGCHAYRKLEGTVEFKGVKFDHRHHLTELRRGKQLRCTSCHSQIVQGEHVAVTEETCFLCHFRGQPPGQPIAGCTGCHASPPRIVSPDGFVVDHPQYVEDVVSCTSCHDRVIEGTGAADRARCFFCHNEPERLEQYENTTLMHRVHLAEHNVECAQCHDPIQHRVVAHTPTFELDCSACHSKAHEAQRELYTGLGGHEAERLPAAMYRARVSCRSCHGIRKELEDHGEVMAGGEALCLSCHGIRYAGILPGWLEEMQRRLERVGAAVGAARTAPGRAGPEERAVADSLLDLAADNVALVRSGGATHNVPYADALLRAALDLTRRAIEVGRLEYGIPDLDLGEPVANNECLRCHLGIERQGGTFDGRRFEHAPHTRRAKLPCSACHTGLDQHGGMLLESAQTCSGCHHSGAIACERCHAGGRGAPPAVIETRTGRFSHPVHLGAGLTCTDCHGGGFGRTPAGCDTCHDRHHVPEVNCSECHREGIQEKHTGFNHTRCSVCHGEKVTGITSWSRNVCLTCHTDRKEHFPPNDCNVCHQLAPLSEP